MSVDLRAGASVADIGGRPVVLTYGNVASEYGALRARAVMFDRSHRGRLRLHGPKAVEMLNGLVSNDIASLAPGHGCYAAALSAKGKIVADIRAFVDAEGVLTDAPPRAFAAWAAMVKKFVNPRLAKHSDESATLRNIGIFGANARHAVESALGVHASALSPLAEYSHLVVHRDGHAITVVRSPELGIEGFDLIFAADQLEGIWDGAVRAGATPAGLEAWEIARIEAGRPEWGVDMDDNTIPQEANFDELHAISYTKGCYVGQETVARVHFRGHVNKHLRGILADGGDPPPPFGATLHDGNGIQIGDVRSSVRSPRLGGVALAMIRREIEPRTRLVARMDGAQPSEQKVTVTTLPFPAL